jgi:hypothetical protein
VFKGPNIDPQQFAADLSDLQGDLCRSITNSQKSKDGFLGSSRTTTKFVLQTVHVDNKPARTYAGYCSCRRIHTRDTSTEHVYTQDTESKAHTYALSGLQGVQGCTRVVSAVKFLWVLEGISTQQLFLCRSSNGNNQSQV